MKKIYNIGDKFGSFTIEQIYDASEIGGVIYEMSTSVCGAKLLFMHSEEENKLFSVTFRTIPSDDTGVFHILEHSVLGGSEKYPVREPFVEMLKSSMHTYLNAMTFPDKTMYPVSSRNERDFLNLTEVYLDAVFKPAIYKNPDIFYQEGWHYELNPKANELSFNGVVFNEMKGAESSVDERLINKINELLYPDTCYKFNSGGDSTKIPTLTYEQFIDTHKKFYSPDNAVFYIEGDLPLMEVISRIDGYLYHEDSFDAAITEIKPQEPVNKDRCVIEYPVSEDESMDRKDHIIFAKQFCDFSDRKKILATRIINEYLNSSSSSIMAGKLLGKYVSDVTISTQQSIKFPYVSIELYGTDIKFEDEIRGILEEVKTDILENGFDKDELESTICRLEFMTREEREPKAIGHLVSSVTNYLYGGNPVAPFEYKLMLNELRNAIEDGYYMEVFKEIFDLDSYSVIIATPSYTLEEKEANDEKARLDTILNRWSSDEVKTVVDREVNLRKWQSTPDTKEQLDTLPKLSISEISEAPIEHKTIEMACDDVKVLAHPLPLTDIAYIKLYFPIDKKYQKDLSKIAFLQELYTELPTSNYDVVGLNREIKKALGSMRFSTAMKASGEDAGAFVSVSISVLKRNLDKIGDLLNEVLYGSKYDSKDIIYRLLNQITDANREDIIAAGNSFARLRANASFTARATATELVDGYEFYKYLKDFRSNYEAEVESFISFAEEFSRDAYTRDGLVVSIAANPDDISSDSFLDDYKLCDMLKCVPAGKSEGAGNPDNYNAFNYRFDYKLPYVEKTFIKIPGKVNYAGTAMYSPALDVRISGKWAVAANVLKLEYLWNKVRVQGGAYGVNFVASREGYIAFGSYRDPNSMETFDAFTMSGNALRAIADSSLDMEKFIISTISDSDPLVAPRALAIRADTDFFDGWTYEDRKNSRREMLEFSLDDLRSIANELDNGFANGLKINAFATCLVGPDCEGYNPDVILEL